MFYEVGTPNIQPTSVNISNPRVWSYTYIVICIVT